MFSAIFKLIPEILGKELPHTLTQGNLKLHSRHNPKTLLKRFPTPVLVQKGETWEFWGWGFPTCLFFHMAMMSAHKSIIGSYVSSLQNFSDVVKSDTHVLLGK